MNRWENKILLIFNKLKSVDNNVWGNHDPFSLTWYKRRLASQVKLENLLKNAFRQFEKLGMIDRA